MKVAHIFTIFSVAFCTLSPAIVKAEEDYHLGFRIAPRISTLGGGLEVAKGLTPWLGLRGGLNYFTYSYDSEESGNQYELELELKSFGLFVDLHPFKQAFRITGGFLINGNEVTGTGKASSLETFDLNGQSYQLTSANAELTYDTFAPYAGIGWDTTFGDHDNWGFTFDIGVVFSGSPELAVNAIESTRVGYASPGTFEENLESERKKLEEDLNDYELWPVISTGIVYQF